MATRLTFGDLLRAGSRALGRYTGTLLSVFVVQAIVAFAVIAACWVALSMTFARSPMWDDAVDGDIVALVTCVTSGKGAMLAASGIVSGGILLWQLATWFLVGGIYGVVANRPEGRGDTARCFGAAGTTTYLAYARLAVFSLPAHVIALFLFLFGWHAMAQRIQYALTVPQLLGPLAVALVPALLALHITWTITDYARVELTLRGESHEPGVVMTYMRTIGYVLKRPLTLAHGALGWVAFAAITTGYIYLSHGHPMYGAEGAVTLFVIRQGVALARTATRFAVLAGQVELGKSRPLPPRRMEPKSEQTKP